MEWKQIFPYYRVETSVSERLGRKKGESKGIQRPSWSFSNLGREDHSRKTGLSRSGKGGLTIVGI